MRLRPLISAGTCVLLTVSTARAQSNSPAVSATYQSIYSVGGRYAQQPDAPPAVRDAFGRFGEALMNRDGATASSLVSRSTIELYERCRQLAMESSTQDFANLTQFEVLLTFQLRYLFSYEQLNAMKSGEAFQWGVVHGLVKQDTVRDITLSQVQVDGNVAFATVIKSGQPVEGAAFRFVREEAQWKLDVLYVNKALEAVFEGIRRKTGKSKIELAVYLMERTYNQQIPFEILHGPIR